MPTSASSSWLRGFGPRAPGAVARVICFPHAGGTAGAFRRLAQLLAPRVEVLAVQYPGRQDRYDDPLIGDMAELAEAISGAVAGELTPRTVFLGHSLGATVAYETARRMRPRYPSPLAGLIVSARKAPHAGAPLGLAFEPDEVRAIVDHLGGQGSELLRDPELWSVALPVLRNDFLLGEHYRHTPGPPLACPITAVVADDDSAFTEADAAAWGEHTMGAFAVRVLSGGHFYFEERPEDLAGVIVQALGVADAFEALGAPDALDASSNGRKS